jgi:hypothetical protein
MTAGDHPRRPGDGLVGFALLAAATTFTAFHSGQYVDGQKATDAEARRSGDVTPQTEGRRRSVA